MELQVENARLRTALEKIKSGSELGTFLDTIEMPLAAVKELFEMEKALAGESK